MKPMKANPAPLTRFQFHLLWIIPAVLLAIATALLRINDWDLQAARAYYDVASIRFLGNQSPWVVFCYRFAAYPAIALGIISLILLALSLAWARVRSWRRICGYFLVAGIVGPGLIVNSLLKEHWGRPRPVQVVEFGGEETFLLVGVPGSSPVARSFPSGHASIAFFAMAPFFPLLTRRRREAWFFLGLGLVWGAVVGVGRVAQGGHWVSDVVWAGAIVYLTCFATARAFGLLRADSTTIEATK